MFQCPYSCFSSFTKEDDMTHHVLDNHIISDILITPSSYLSTDFLGVNSSPSVVDYQNIGDFFSDLHCKEPVCARHDAYESISYLIEHYDRYHSFIHSPGTIGVKFRNSKSYLALMKFQ
ncbi:uncharacterized protein PRCAT00002434001 [Priceomyces carsonii]|uniref:uncharacterized protein n=1 Tax=Priceomyces carsonii TaxID=28549 RepID=UPI002EDA951C|nr:unnamed protein product [Priceomyces carsonii]